MAMLKPMDCAERIWTDKSLSPPLLVYCEDIILQLLDAIGYTGQTEFECRTSVYFAVKSCYRLPVLGCLATSRRWGRGDELERVSACARPGSPIPASFATAWAGAPSC